jgi:hypothetical protein
MAEWGPTVILRGNNHQDRMSALRRNNYATVGPESRQLRKREGKAGPIRRRANTNHYCYAASHRRASNRAPSLLRLCRSG